MPAQIVRKTLLQLSKWAFLSLSAPKLKVIYLYRQSKFATFPEVLVLHAKKFQLVNWVPTKLGK